jgi:hypothetical protein
MIWTDLKFWPYLSEEETRPPCCTVVHFTYILMNPDPNWKACHQHIRLATNMKFAGVNIYGHPNIWCEDQHRVDHQEFFLSSWIQEKSTIYQTFSRTNHNPSSRAPYMPYDKRKQLWKNFCNKIICQSHHTHCHFNTTSNKIYMTNKTWLSNIPSIHSWICNGGLVSVIIKLRMCALIVEEATSGHRESQPRSGHLCD